VVERRLVSRVEPSALVEEFLPLNRRRTRGDPPLSIAELERWMELRSILERALAGKPPVADQRRPMRRTLRVPTHLKVRFTRGSTIDVSSTKEISEGGLFLTTRRPLAPGTPLHLEIEGSDPGAPIDVEGTVAWVAGPTTKVRPGWESASITRTRRSRPPSAPWWNRRSPSLLSLREVGDLG
jgi:hypothetical protein